MNYTDIDAEAIFPKEIRLVNERLSSSNNYLKMIQIIETFLLEIINRKIEEMNHIDTVAQTIIEQPENINININ